MNADAPSHSARSYNYIRLQDAYPTYDGRYKVDKPRTSVAPPVQLFHPAFAYFLDDIKSVNPLPHAIIQQTVEYMKAATAVYESEKARRMVL